MKIYFEDSGKEEQVENNTRIWAVHRDFSWGQHNAIASFSPFSKLFHSQEAIIEYIGKKLKELVDKDELLNALVSKSSYIHKRSIVEWLQIQMEKE